MSPVSSHVLRRVLAPSLASSLLAVALVTCRTSAGFVGQRHQHQIYRRSEKGQCVPQGLHGREVSTRTHVHMNDVFHRDNELLLLV